jgi:cysteine-rich repeat protein
MSINLKEGNVVEEEDSDAYLLFEVEQETVQDIFAKGGNLGETFFDNIVSGKIKMSKLDNRGIFESMGDWVSGLFGDDEVFNETVECSEIHEPVCGVDGITYPNGCFANQFNIEIENSGECQENDPTSSLAQCGNLIVDLMIERDNCGMCGVSCDDDQECIAGECVYENLVQCSGKIVDVNTDNDNCGICGTSCDEDYKCSDGVCVNNVFTQCSGKNVFLDSNEANCGICGVSCENNEMCMEGICKPTSVCGDGIISISYEECDDGNNVNEDACTNDCKFKNRNLVEESCEYQAGGGMGDLMCIGGIDVETCIIAYQGDYFANSNNCDPLYPANAALVECSGKTIDIMNDESNCGMCGISCDDDYKCRNGACEIEILCGDGFLTPNEECDDGNSNNNDMCSNSCEIIEENIPQPDSCEYVHPIRGLVCETGIDVETCIIAYQGDYFDSSDCDGGSTYSSEDPNSIYNEHYVQEDEWTGTSCLYAHPGSGDMTCTNGVDIGLCVAGYQGDLYNVPNCEGRGDLGIDVGCPIGEYGDGTNCFDCPRGSYQPLEHNEKGRDSCKSCPIGSYNNEAGMEICNLCEIDTYTNLTGTMKCRECTEGYSTNGLFGSQSCVEINNDDGMKLYEEELISTTISQVNKIPESVN